MPLSWQNVGGTITLTGTGTDELQVAGTSNNDSVTASSTAVTINSRAYSISSLETITLNLGDGDDSTSVTPAAGVVFNVNAGDPSASDSLTFNGTLAANDVTIDLTAQTITEAGLGAVAFTGVESVTLALVAGTQNVIVTGTSG